MEALRLLHILTFMRTIRHTVERRGERARSRFGGCARSLRARTGLFACALLLVWQGCQPKRTTAAQSSAPRLVSTAPNLTEIVFAIGAGDQLVGRTESCDYPSECRRIPTVGGFGAPNLEPLLAARPTLVLETVLADPDIARRLESLHIPVEHIACTRLDDIPEAIRRVGTLTKREVQARRLADEIGQGLAASRRESRPAAAKPKIALLVSADPAITTGRRAFVSELITLAGGTNVGDVSDVDYYHISTEWLLAQNPDMLLCLFETGVRDPPALFASQTGWRALAAVRDRRVYAVADLNAVCRPGPRVLEGLSEIKRILALDAARATAH